MSNQQKMLQICLEEDVSLFCLKARRGGEFEWPMITAEELQKTVESRGQKASKKKYQTAPTSPHVVWEGFKKILEKKTLSSKNKL